MSDIEPKLQTKLLETPIEDWPTSADIDAHRTPAGAWTRETLAHWGIPWPPPKGWKAAIEQKNYAWFKQLVGNAKVSAKPPSKAERKKQLKASKDKARKLREKQLKEQELVKTAEHFRNEAHRKDAHAQRCRQYEDARNDVWPIISRSLESQ